MNLTGAPQSFEVIQISRISEIFEINEKLLGHCLFRGQTNSTWELWPSLFRAAKYGNSDIAFYNFLEELAVKKFFHRGAHLISDPRRSYYFDRIIAQHFGVPTRLLDWSRDPLIALFFSVEDGENNPTDDGAIFVLSNVGENFIMDPAQDISYGGATIAMINPPILDGRVSAQRSVFTIQKDLFDDEGYIPLEKRGFGEGTRITKLVIPSGLKFHFKLRLEEFGVDRSSIYPGLESLAERIRSNMSVQHPAS